MSLMKAPQLVLLLLMYTAVSHEAIEETEEFHHVSDAFSNGERNTAFLASNDATYIGPRPKCLYSMMPIAECPNRCLASRKINGASDCSKCTIYRMMPPAQCAQCSAEKPCNECFKYGTMPINQCRTPPKTGYPTPGPEYPPHSEEPPKPTPEHTNHENPPSEAPTNAPPTNAPPTNAPPTDAPTDSPTNRPETRTPKPHYGGDTGKTEAPESSKQTKSASKKLSAGAIAGIVIACCALVGFVAFFAWKKLKDKEREEQMFGEPAELENPDSSADYAAM